MVRILYTAAQFLVADTAYKANFIRTTSDYFERMYKRSKTDDIVLVLIIHINFKFSTWLPYALMWKKLSVAKVKYFMLFDWVHDSPFTVQWKLTNII